MVLALVLVLLLDQITKVLITEAGVFRLTVIPGFLWFERATNTGIAFGMFSSHTDQITMISIAVVIFLAIYYTRFSHVQQIFIGMIMGGALGNIIDRIRFGKVVDFIRMRYYPAIFNVADSFIVIGGILLALTYLWGDKFGSKGDEKRRGMETGQVFAREASKLDISLYDSESYKGWEGACGWLDQKAELQGEERRDGEG